MIIHYICSFDDYNNSRQLNTQPSGVTKINYIKSALKRAGHDVILFSTAESNNKRMSCYPHNRIVVDNHESIVFPFIIGRKNFFLKVLSKVLLLIQLTFYLLFKVKKNHCILLYHSLSMMTLIKMITFIKNEKIYIEVEEIYNAAYQNDIKKINNEISFIKNTAKGLLLVNDIIGTICEFKQPSISCYGIYESTNNIFDCKNRDNINVLYAGVIGGPNSDAYVAIKLGFFLPEKYVVHVLGYGSPNDISYLKRYLLDNETKFKCKVFYHGCLLGQEYLNFISTCQIGLCPRLLENNFSDYTFPSKVLVYMANNILPICTPLSCIENSVIKKYLLLTKDSSVASFAQAIKDANLNIVSDYKNILDKLDANFVSELRSFFVCDKN